MTQHLWVAWGYTYVVRCRRVEWDHTKTTSEHGNRIVWQGDGPRCKRCETEAAALGRHLSSALQGVRDPSNEGGDRGGAARSPTADQRQPKGSQERPAPAKAASGPEGVCVCDPCPSFGGDQCQVAVIAGKCSGCSSGHLSGPEGSVKP